MPAARAYTAKDAGGHVGLKKARPEAPVEDGSALGIFKTELRELLLARYPIVHVSTYEEDRALSAIEDVAQTVKQTPIYWSTSRGVFSPDDKKPGRWRKGSFGLEDLTAAIEAFEKRARSREPVLFILLDPHPYLSQAGTNPIYRRRLKDLSVNIRTQGYHANCLLVAPAFEIPHELEKEITIVDFPLPDRDEIARYVGEFIKKIGAVKSVEVSKDPELLKGLVDASLGLTLIEVESALAKAVVQDRALDMSDIQRIFSQKRQTIRKSGVLEYFDTRDLSVDDIGGLEVLKRWLEIRKLAFSHEARDFGIQVPKGVLLTGVPGCGKSLTAKCVAASWGLPLIRLDMGKIYSSLVGSSEEHMRTAIQTCEAVAPCVLWIDEIEKGLTAGTRYIGDSGVSLRVLSSFLTWLQEKVAPVFVFATANQIALLPPEVLRKGRFDEIFFVDLPIDRERREILEIHIRAVHRDPTQFDLDELVSLSGPKNFGDDISMTGAEIAAWVNESLTLAFHRKTQTNDPSMDLTMDHFRRVVERTVPLATLRRADIQGMRTWADQNAINASYIEPHTAAHLVVGGRRLDL